MPKVMTNLAYVPAGGAYSGPVGKGHRDQMWKALRAAGVITDVNRPTINTAGPANLGASDAGMLFFDANATSIARTLQASGAANEETVVVACRVDTNPANSVVLSAFAGDTVQGGASISVPVGAIIALQLPAGANNWRLLYVGGTQAGMREAMNVPLFNWLDNPDGAVYQRSPAATADDNYASDRWNILTQTGTVTPSQLNYPEDGFRNGLRITQSQAVAQRFGDSQIMDGRSTAQLRGKVVSAGGRFRMSAAGNVRLAILAWTGTENSVTSDVVNNWASGVYTAGNFFNAANLTVVATNSKALAAATIDSASVTGTVPANANNLIYFFFTEATQAQNVTLDRWGQRVVEASTLVDHIRRSHSEELFRCQRTLEFGTARMQGYQLSGNQNKAVVFYKVPKLGVPTLTLSGHADSGNVSGVGAIENSASQFSYVCTASATSAFFTNDDFKAEFEL